MRRSSAALLFAPLFASAAGGRIRRSVCTGRSVNLTADDCAAWGEIYDYGHGWEQCDRSDPCGCGKGSNLPIGCGPLPGPVVPWINALDCAPTCGAGASCCRDPLTTGSTGACFTVPTCSDICDPPPLPPPDTPWRIMGIVLDPSGGSSRTLTGAIPSALGKLTGLVQLIISGNALTGAIPPTLANLTRLTQLFLSYNQLEGQMPPSLSTLTNIGALVLDCNRLSGALPAFAFEKAQICYANYEQGFGNSCSSVGLEDNSFSCPLPKGAELCHAKCMQ